MLLTNSAVRLERVFADVRFAIIVLVDIREVIASHQWEVRPMYRALPPGTFGVSRLEREFTLETLRAK